MCRTTRARAASNSGRGYFSACVCMLRVQQNMMRTKECRKGINTGEIRQRREPTEGQPLLSSEDDSDRQVSEYTSEAQPNPSRLMRTPQGCECVGSAVFS